MLALKVRTFFTKLNDDPDFKDGFTHPDPEYKTKDKKVNFCTYWKVRSKLLGSTNEHLKPLLTMPTNADMTIAIMGLANWNYRQGFPGEVDD
jgi:hypothetical protein